MKVTILEDPSLVIITMYTYFVWSMPGSRADDFFLKNTSILHFLPHNYLPLGVGVMTSPYPTDAIYQIKLRLAQKFLRRRY